MLAVDFDDTSLAHLPRFTRPIRLSEKSDQEEDPPRTLLRRAPAMANIFVGNMSFQTDEAELRALFEPYGEITRVHIPTDRDTGRARGFAFVEMADSSAAANAITALNGRELGGRQLRINEAQPKGERSGGGGGGGAGRGGRGGRGGGGGYSRDDYRGAARQPREPRW
jgi:cold-inducible RNA-binding protein